MASKGSTLRQAGEMRVKSSAVMNEGVKVLSVLPHVVDNLHSVVEVIVGAAVKLISQCSKQTVPVSWNLFESESQCPQLVVETGETVLNFLYNIVPH